MRVTLKFFLISVLLIFSQTTGCKYFKRAKLTPIPLPNQTADQQRPGPSESAGGGGAGGGEGGGEGGGGGAVVCGNGSCETGETNVACPADCPAGDTTAPTVVTASPANLATNVPRNTTVQISFSEPIDPASVTSETLSITAGTTPVEGGRLVEGVVITFTAASRLAHSTGYTVTGTAGIKDLAGNPLAASFTTSFTTAGRGWGTAIDIEGISDNLLMPLTSHLAFDPSGNATAIWSSLVAADGVPPIPTATQIYTRRYNRTTALWETVNQFDSGDPYVWAFPQIGFLPDGSARAVWGKIVGSETNIVSSVAWNSPTSIDSLPGTASMQRLAMAPNGNALVIWNQNEGAGSYGIYANQCSGTTGAWGSGISPSTPIDGVAGPPDVAPNVAYDANGNAMLIWTQRPDTVAGSKYNVYAAYYSAATTTLGPAVEVDTLPGSAESTQLVTTSISGTVRFAAVWAQRPTTDAGAVRDIYSRTYNPATSAWVGSAAPMDTATGDASSPRAAVQPGAANSVLVWLQNDGSTWRVYSRYFAEGAPLPPVIQVSSGTGRAKNPQVVMDTAGNAIAVWEQEDHSCGVPPDPCSSIYASRYQPAVGWGTPVLLETDDSGDAASPWLALDNEGNAFAIWIQNSLDSTGAETGRGVFVNRFE